MIIKLTDLNNSPVYFNFDHVAYFKWDYNNKNTIITFIAGVGVARVLETAEDIIAILKIRGEI